MRACSGTTKRGQPCRVLTAGERCPAHGGTLKTIPPQYRCTGRNKKGVPCFAKVPDKGGRCGHHPVVDAALQPPAWRYQCTAWSKRGNSRCLSRIAVEGGRCAHHALELDAQAAAE
jgi:hypothetical protein